MARIVIVGAGVGGLAVAARLAAKGHDVTVVERSDRIGGKLQTLRRDGFAFDLGPSLFTLPAVYRDLFRRTGHPLEDEVGLVETEPGFRYRFGDGSLLRLPGSSVGRTAATIGEQFGTQAGQDWRRLMDRAADIWRLTRTDVLGTAIDSPRQLMALSRPDALRAVAPWRRLHGLASSILHDPRLVTVLDRYATYSGSDPRRAPGALITIPFVEHTFGLWHLAGGLGTLADALRARAERAGATFRLGAAVTRIDHDAAGVRGVELHDGERLDAQIVVSDIDARLMPTLLGRRAPRSREHSYSGFAILAAVQGHSAELHHHNVWFPPAYRREFTDLAAGRPVHDPAVYICRPDDATMAPDGHEAWFVLVNAPRHGSGRAAFDWQEPGVSERYADHVLATLARRGTDIRDRVAWRIVQTPADLGARDGTDDGAIYGHPSHGAFSVLRRAPNVDPIPGLYRVGGTAHPGGGLPLVGMGAEIVAERIGRARRSRTADR